MNKKIGGVKVIVGGVLVVGVVAIMAVLLVVGKNNEQPSGIGVATTETKETAKNTKNSKDTDDKQSADDSFVEPKGVSETVEPKDHEQSKHNNQPSKKPSKKSSTQSTTNNDQVDNSNQSIDSESTDNSNDKNTANNDNDEEAARAEAEEARRQEELARVQAQYQYPTVYQADNSYKWKDDCPGGTDNLIIQSIGGYYVCQCTSYVAWKTFEATGIILSNWGNANFWDTMASANGYLVNNIPTANSIGQIKDGGYGHLFWVEQVYSDGSIAITEYNNPSSTYQLTGDYHVQDFGARIISAQAAANYRYIHPNQRVW